MDEEVEVEKTYSQSCCRYTFSLCMNECVRQRETYSHQCSLFPYDSNLYANGQVRAEKMRNAGGCPSYHICKTNKHTAHSPIPQQAPCHLRKERGREVC